ncbi:hypothetical protein [Mycobacterium malmoense]|uniref:hypothetical protein n=1 Tax=Mycobacterium malmoense TaxID=1780 RepID=UPI0008F941E3|nr:hypothetical protein [Mycobacterium malmoense]OIN80868.1 hypothetical protein BMG05_11075 [Mycobacterium malmoense]
MARTKNFGQLSGRLLELSVKTLVPDPYPVTDKISVEAPTKRRAETMRDTHAEMLVYQALLNDAVKRAGEPRPQPPTAEPGQEPTGEEVDEHNRLVAEWETAVADWESRAAANNTEMAALSTKVREVTDAYNRAFFGDAHDDVMAFFADQPQALWDAFIEDIQDHFLPHPPTDDDEGEAAGEGKPRSSST